MKQGPYWEASSSSIVHEFRHLLWNQRVHHRPRDSPTVYYIPSQINQITLSPSRSPFKHDISIYAFIIQVVTSFQSYPLKFLVSPTPSVQCSSHITVPEMLLLKMCEGYKFLSSSLRNFLCPPISSSFLKSTFTPQVPVLNVPPFMFLPSGWKTKFQNLAKLQISSFFYGKIVSVALSQDYVGG
jgi:hypothetical protein